MMKVSGFFKPLNALTLVNDDENIASMAAGTKAFQDECTRMGQPMEMIVNLATPWYWTGGPRWQDAVPKVVDFWWSLGVRGVLLEKPEARPPRQRRLPMQSRRGLGMAGAGRKALRDHRGRN